MHRAQSQRPVLCSQLLCPHGLARAWKTHHQEQRRHVLIFSPQPNSNEPQLGMSECVARNYLDLRCTFSLVKADRAGVSN
jgi:hypothetical protein